MPNTRANHAAGHRAAPMATSLTGSTATAAAGLPTPNLERVVILSAHEGHARVDRAMLRALGADTIAMFSRGEEALEYLQNWPVGLLVVDQRLADMTVETLLAELQGIPALVALPVVLAGLGNGEVAALKIMASTSMGLLQRPYSQADMEREIRRAKGLQLPERGDAATGRWAARVDLGRSRTHAAGHDRPRQARSLCLEGRRSLVAGQPAKAEAAFVQALEQNSDYPEACEGLGLATRALGQEEKGVELLLRACQLYALQDRYADASRIAKELRREGLAVENPFLAAGKELRLREDLDAAVLAYRRAVQFDPADERALVALTEGLLESDRREEAMRTLELALERRPDFPELRRMKQALTTPREKGLVGKMAGAMGMGHVQQERSTFGRGLWRALGFSGSRGAARTPMTIS